eukprot:gene1470-11391_t
MAVARATVMLAVVTAMAAQHARAPAVVQQAPYQLHNDNDKLPPVLPGAPAARGDAGVGSALGNHAVPIPAGGRGGCVGNAGAGRRVIPASSAALPQPVGGGRSVKSVTGWREFRAPDGRTRGRRRGPAQVAAGTQGARPRGSGLGCARLRNARRAHVAACGAADPCAGAVGHPSRDGGIAGAAAATAASGGSSRRGERALCTLWGEAAPRGRACAAAMRAVPPSPSDGGAVAGARRR